MKREFKSILVIILSLILFTSCANNKGDNKAFDDNKDIIVISREDGSGTRGAFVELMGIEEDGVDNTTLDAIVSNNTSVVMTSVQNDKYAIGYISLGSLNDTIKAVKVDGVDANIDNIKDGSYKVARPFNIATKGEPNELARDFIDFILSDDGQAVVEESGFISTDSKGAFESSKPSGKITIAGSSSVTPVIEKLKEAYNEINPDLTIEIQQSDSTAGMQGTIDGVCDIGMASRELKESELEHLTPQVIAMDGIAIVVNNNNPIDDLSSEQIKNIFIGEYTVWSEVK